MSRVVKVSMSGKKVTRNRTNQCRFYLNRIIPTISNKNKEFVFTIHYSYGSYEMQRGIPLFEKKYVYLLFRVSYRVRSIYL